MTTKSYSSMGLSGEERGYTEKRIRAGEKPAPTIKSKLPGKPVVSGSSGNPGKTEPLLSKSEAIAASYMALVQCRSLGLDTSKWEQILADVCGEGINGIKVHL